MLQNKSSSAIKVDSSPAFKALCSATPCIIRKYYGRFTVLVDNIQIILESSFNNTMEVISNSH